MSASQSVLPELCAHNLRRLLFVIFPDRETLVRVSRPVGRQAVLVRSLDEPNVKVFEVLLAADALRRAGARSLTLVCPYLSYMRQDKVFRAGEPISQLVVGRLLSTGFDRVITLEPHLHRVRNLGQVFQCRAESLSAAPLIARWKHGLISMVYNWISSGPADRRRMGTSSHSTDPGCATTV